MTWVKICGMTNLEDALVAVEAGADAMGFVFHEKSLRRVHPETAEKIAASVPDNIEKVGVFVNHTAEQVIDISDRVGLNAVQWYPPLSNESPSQIDDFLRKIERRTFMAIPGQRFSAGEHSGFFFSDEVLRRVSAVFLDSGNTQQPGGTGQPFDWESAAERIRTVREAIPVVIAGGLTAANVGEAIGILQPWGVDVASGVEAIPGKKDPQKVRAFVKAARLAEKSARK